MLLDVASVALFSVRKGSENLIAIMFRNERQIATIFFVDSTLAIQKHQKVTFLIIFDILNFLFGDFCVFSKLRFTKMVILQHKMW